MLMLNNRIICCVQVDEKTKYLGWSLFDKVQLNTFICAFNPSASADNAFCTKSAEVRLAVLEALLNIFGSKDKYCCLVDVALVVLFFCFV